MSGFTLNTKNMGSGPEGLTFILRGISFISAAYETGTSPHIGVSFDPDSQGCSAYDCFDNNQHTLLKMRHNGKTFDLLTWNILDSFRNPQCGYTGIEFATGRTHNGQPITNFFSDGATFDLIYGIQSADQAGLCGALDFAGGFDTEFPIQTISNAGRILVDDPPPVLTRANTPEYIGIKIVEGTSTSLTILTDPNSSAVYTINGISATNVQNLPNSDRVSWQTPPNEVWGVLGLSGATLITGSTLTATNNDGETAEIGLKFVPDLQNPGFSFFNTSSGANHGSSAGFTFTLSSTSPSLYQETISRIRVRFPGQSAFTTIPVQPLGGGNDKLTGFLPEFTGTVPPGGTAIQVQVNNLGTETVPAGVTINNNNTNTSHTILNAYTYYPGITITGIGSTSANYFIGSTEILTTIFGENLGPTNGITFSIGGSSRPILDSSTPAGGLTLFVRGSAAASANITDRTLTVTMGNRSASIRTAVLARPTFGLTGQQRFIQGNVGSQSKGFSGSNFITSAFAGITQFASARIGNTGCAIDYSPQRTTNTSLTITVPELGVTWGGMTLTYTHPGGTAQASIEVYLQPVGTTISPSGFTAGVTSTATITGTSLLSVNQVFFEKENGPPESFNVPHNVISNTAIGITVGNDIPAGQYSVQAMTQSSGFINGPWILFTGITVETPPPPVPTTPLAYQLFGATGLTQHGFTWSINQNSITSWFTTQWSPTGDYRMGYDGNGELVSDSVRFTQRLAHASQYLQHVNNVRLPHKIRHEATGITMVLVIPDGFSMGATGAAWGPASLWGATMSRPKEERYVTLTNPYYISESVLTEKMIQGTGGHTFNPYIIDSQTKFDEANTKFREIGMRLPVEAEWEFAARSLFVGSTLDNTQYHSSKRYRSSADISGGYSFDRVTWSAPTITGLFDTIGLVKELMGNTGYSYASESAVNPRIPTGQETETAGYLIKGSSGHIATHLSGASKDLVTRGYLFFGNTAGNTLAGITNATPSPASEKQDIWSVARRDIVFGLTGNTGNGTIWPGPVRTGVGLRAIKPIHLGGITAEGNCCFNNICYSATESACLAVGGITGCSGCTCDPTSGPCGVLCCAYGQLTCELNCAACISKPPPPSSNIWWSGFNLNGITVANVNATTDRRYNRFDLSGITSGAGITLVSQTTFTNTTVGLTHGIIVSGLPGNAITLLAGEFQIGSRTDTAAIFRLGGPNGTTHVMRLPAGFPIGPAGNPRIDSGDGWVFGVTFQRASIGNTCDPYVWTNVIQPKHCSTGFIGFRYHESDVFKNYYGWIGFEVKFDLVNKKILYITDWAYNKTPDEEIHTGQGRIYPPQCGSSCTDLGDAGTCNPIGCDPGNPDCDLCCKCKPIDGFEYHTCEPCTNSGCDNCTPSIKTGSCKGLEGVP